MSGINREELRVILDEAAGRQLELGKLFSKLAIEAQKGIEIGNAESLRWPILLRRLAGVCFTDTLIFSMIATTLQESLMPQEPDSDLLNEVLGIKGLTNYELTEADREALKRAVERLDTDFLSTLQSPTDMNLVLRDKTYYKKPSQRQG